MENPQNAQQEQKPFFFYGEKTITREVKNKKGVVKKLAPIKRRVAYAGVIMPDGILNIGQSMCSEKDIFLKSKARTIALGRAYKKPESMLKLDTVDKPVAQFIKKAKQLIAE